MWEPAGFHIFIYRAYSLKKQREKFVYLGNFLYLCRVKITQIIHHLKHIKVMNKTVKKILQVISYIISLLLGAGKNEKLKK